MSLQVMIVNGDRHLINTDSSGVDKNCEDILNYYPSDAVVDFEKPDRKDLIPINLKQISDGTK